MRHLELCDASCGLRCKWHNRPVNTNVHFAIKHLPSFRLSHCHLSALLPGIVNHRHTLISSICNPIERCLHSPVYCVNLSICWNMPFFGCARQQDGTSFFYLHPVEQCCFICFDLLLSSIKDTYSKATIAFFCFLLDCPAGCFLSVPLYDLLPFTCFEL